MTREGPKEISSLKYEGERSLKCDHGPVTNILHKIFCPGDKTETLLATMTFSTQDRRAGFVHETCANSGVTKAVMSYNLVKKHKLPTIPTKEMLWSANGTPISGEGECTLDTTYEGLMLPNTFIVTKAVGNGNIFFSWYDCINLEILPRNFP